MAGNDFSPEQQEYFKGFMAGVEARRGSLAPAGGGGGEGGGAPPDAMRAAQDAAVAKGGKLTAEEKAKRAKHPLDRWDEVVARAEQGKFPHGVDNLLTRWHGLFYVGPTQDAFMCRLRIPGGFVSTHQFRGIADIAEECGGGWTDVTTRNNLQIRMIPADKGPEVIHRLGDLGILPKGTGADNIRNITCNPTSGIDPDELIDTRPIVRALHYHILHSRDLFGLPRKFNISLDGGGRVAVLEDTNDIAFTAVKVGEEALFRLGLGGITGHRDFARGTDVVVPARRRGEGLRRDPPRVPRQRRPHQPHEGAAEIRARRLGPAALPRSGGGADRRQAPPRRGRRSPPRRRSSTAISASTTRSSPGLQYIGIVVPVARITAERMRGLADIADRFGSGLIRLTVWQNLLISDIPRERMAEAQAAIAALGLGWEASQVRGGLVACTGNAGCKFAASNTKQHAAELADYLDARITVTKPINIHLTGCHNSCAQHYIGDIGLIGAKVERGEDEEVEGYDLHVGGGAGTERQIGRLVRPKVAHDELNPMVLNLLRAWQAEAPELSFQDFTARHDEAALRAIAESAATP